MYTMKEVCKETGMTYEGLKFYCNQGLVPNVKRDKNNRRVFDEHAMCWVKSLSCLKNCEMSIAEMQQYLAYCLEGPSSIPVRKEMLAKKQDELRKKSSCCRRRWITSTGSSSCTTIYCRASRNTIATWFRRKSERRTS